jgi:hypothetical protein
MTERTTDLTSAPETNVTKPQAVVASRKPNPHADVLLAKKKHRRAAHRATIKRSNANG